MKAENKVKPSDEDRKAAALKGATDNALHGLLVLKQRAILEACSTEEVEEELIKRGVAY